MRRHQAIAPISSRKFTRVKTTNGLKFSRLQIAPFGRQPRPLLAPAAYVFEISCKFTVSKIAPEISPTDILFTIFRLLIPVVIFAR